MASHAKSHPMSGDDDGTTATAAEQGLVERLQRGDTAAARELYLCYYDRLLRFAYGYVHSRALAEELVQDTFLALLERTAGEGKPLELREGIRTYLYAAVRNRALKVLEHERVVQRTETQAAQDERIPGMGSAAPLPDERLEGDALAALVARAIATLPEKRRTALMLRWRHRLPYAEIARIMGISLGAATIHVARARETIVALMKEVE